MTGVSAYQRKYQNQAIFVFLNGNDHDQVVELEQYQEVLNDGIKFRKILNDEIIYLNSSFVLKAREALILELQTNSAPPPPTTTSTDQNENKKNDKNKKIIIITSSCVVAVLIIVVVVAAVVFAIKYRKKGNILIENTANEVNTAALLEV